MLGTRSNQIESTISRAVTPSRAVFITSTALIYAITIFASTLTLNAYFAQTWDVQTFIQAAHRFLDGGNPFDLYAASRAAQTWPYAYPPLHALVTSKFLWIGGLLPAVPDYLWARVPPLLADIGVGIALHAIVLRKTADESLARAAILLWLFNPVTLYDTAVQGHFESEWILFIVLAYYWHENSPSIILPTLALAMAVLFKQIAILFVIPYWINVTLSEAKGLASPDDQNLRFAQNDNLKRVFQSIVLFSLVCLVICLPFLLYSNDFLYMNLTYVENVPVQTQSWVVALLALTRPAPEALTSDFFFLRYGTFIALLAALAVSIFAARRRWSVWLAGSLIAIIFFLISRKVMGYYYVMLFPFMLTEFVPRRRFGIILASTLLSSYIALSPYYAPWGNPNHIWIYAALGAVNSALFVWIFVRMTQDGGQTREGATSVIRPSTSVVLFITLGLFACAVIAALLQPFAPNGGSPIRVPFIAPGAEAAVLAAFTALLVLILLGLGLISRRFGKMPRAAWISILAFAPLFFVVYYLTKESTAAFEFVLNVIGV